MRIIIAFMFVTNVYMYIYHRFCSTGVNIQALPWYEMLISAGCCSHGSPSTCIGALPSCNVIWRSRKYNQSSINNSLNVQNYSLSFIVKFIYILRVLGAGNSWIVFFCSISYSLFQSIIHSSIHTLACWLFIYSFISLLVVYLFIHLFIH